MWTRPDGSTVKLLPGRLEIKTANGQRQIIPANLDRRRLGEYLHSRGFRYIAV